MYVCICKHLCNIEQYPDYPISFHLNRSGFSDPTISVYLPYAHYYRSFLSQ